MKYEWWLYNLHKRKDHNWFKEAINWNHIGQILLSHGPVVASIGAWDDDMVPFCFPLIPCNLFNFAATGGVWMMSFFSSLTLNLCSLVWQKLDSPFCVLISSALITGSCGPDLKDFATSARQSKGFQGWVLFWKDSPPLNDCLIGVVLNGSIFEEVWESIAKVKHGH